MRIAVISDAGIGNQILKTPALQAIRAAYPDSIIDYYGESHGIIGVETLRHIGIINTLTPWTHKQRLSTRNYDLGFNLAAYRGMTYIFEKTRAIHQVTYNWKRGEHESVKSLSEIENVTGKRFDFKCLYHVGKEINDKIKRDYNYEYIAISPDTRDEDLYDGRMYWKNRQWPKEYWEDLVSKLIKNYRVIILGRGNTEVGDYLSEKIKRDLVNLQNKTTLEEAAAIIKNAKCLISLDTGLLHVGAGVGTKLVGLYGPSMSSKSKPFTNSRVKVITSEVDCSPCITRLKQFRNCRDNKCMKQISVSKVYNEVLDLIDENRKKILLVWHRNIYRKEYPMPQGGELSSKSIMDYLSNDFNCTVHITSGKFREYNHGNIVVYETEKTMKDLKDVINKVRPDIILTNGSMAPDVNQFATEAGIPFLVFVRFWWVFGYRNHNNLKQILEQNYPGRHFGHYEQAMKNAKYVIGNCDYVTKCIKKFFKRDDAVTILSPVFKDNIIAGKSDSQYITIMNYKNELVGDIVQKISKLLPDEKFLCISDKFNIDKNITEIPRVEYSNIKDIYRQTKILLYPSLVDGAGHGRVCYEAAYNGIPIITNGYGGLREFVKDFGIVLSTNASDDEWAKAIRVMNADYKNFVMKTLSRMSTYNPTVELDKIKRIIKNIEINKKKTVRYYL